MQRLITALALIAVALYLIWLSPYYVFSGAALLVGWLCYREYAGLVVAHGIRRPGLVGLLLGFCIILVPHRTLEAAMLLVVIQFAVSLRRGTLREILPETGATVLGAFYAFAPWSFAVLLRSQSVHLLFFALALNWVGDSAAYYAGRRFGRHKLAPQVSPGKSWEGAVASVLGSVIFGLIYLGRMMPELSFLRICSMALIANIAGQLGDLAESAVKRGAGLKDSGTLLPGHGGILDRLDSSLFAVPVTYLLYNLVS